MLGKVLVALIAVAAVAVGGYYYYDTIGNSTPADNPCGDKPSCCQSEVVQSAPSCCSNPSREAFIAGCCQASGTGSEILTVSPRVVEVEAAPIPREAQVE